ncbi:MAG: hypothetical protein KAI89_09685 [Emcibacter sp.]|nr:hypothetical protein [Emcibacter sp.]
MGNLVRVLGFSFAIILVFTYVANLLPQMEGEAPVDEEVDLGELTMESFVSLGEKIFSGKGTCTLCHNNMGRAPDLLTFDLVGISPERMADSRYAGSADDAESYIRESLIDPGVYVVTGFGKKGSNDTESPMPDVSKSPIQLSELEIDAVIAFLQFKDGNDITVSLPTDAPVIEEDDDDDEEEIATTAEAAMEKFMCSGCHDVFDSEAEMGPSFKDTGSKLTRSEILESILYPNAVIAEGFEEGMPDDIAEDMAMSELTLIVEYLVNQKEEKK